MTIAANGPMSTSILALGRPMSLCCLGTQLQVHSWRKAVIRWTLIDALVGRTQQCSISFSCHLFAGGRMENFVTETREKMVWWNVLLFTQTVTNSATSHSSLISEAKTVSWGVCISVDMWYHYILGVLRTDQQIRMQDKVQRYPSHVMTLVFCFYLLLLNDTQGSNEVYFSVNLTEMETLLFLQCFS